MGRKKGWIPAHELFNIRIPCTAQMKTVSSETFLKVRGNHMFTIQLQNHWRKYYYMRMRVFEFMNPFLIFMNWNHEPMSIHWGNSTFTFYSNFHCEHSTHCTLTHSHIRTSVRQQIFKIQYYKISRKYKWQLKYDAPDIVTIYMIFSYRSHCRHETDKHTHAHRFYSHRKLLVWQTPFPDNSSIKKV